MIDVFVPPVHFGTLASTLCGCSTEASCDQATTDGSLVTCRACLAVRRSDCPHDFLRENWSKRSGEWKCVSQTCVKCETEVEARTEPDGFTVKYVAKESYEEAT